MQMENFAPFMFGALVFIMLIGFPVAFSLAALGLASGFFAIEMGWFPVSFMAPPFAQLCCESASSRSATAVAMCRAARCPKTQAGPNVEPGPGYVRPTTAAEVLPAA